MSNDGVDVRRRRFLTATASVVGGVGTVFAAYPFLSAFMPSARAQAAGAAVKVDISKLEVGGMLTVEWRKTPVWVVRRSSEVLDVLPSLNDRLRDPQSENKDQTPDFITDPVNRSLKKEILVLEGVCTHLGCSPKYRPEMVPEEFDKEWKGGFFCPCHGSKFDMAGRVFQGVPAPTNLKVPPYKFLGDNLLLIGEV
jgi:ubiquinol-cytochrome c reductase iron-sulfur subunit